VCLRLISFAFNLPTLYTSINACTHKQILDRTYIDKENTSYTISMVAVLHIYILFELDFKKKCFFNSLGYGDRRRNNDDDSTVYDAQETHG
jgi:hypothetical protein